MRKNLNTEGFGGRFGDEGGGVLVAPYVDWIESTTGIPEPYSAALIFGALVAWVSRRLRYRS